MRLTSCEKEVLFALHHQADLSIVQLASRLKRKVHTVRHALNRLYDSSIIRFIPLINRAALGLTDHHIRCSLKASKQEVRTSFIHTLAKKNGVVTIAELGGDYHYEIILAAKNPQSALTLFEEELEQYKIQLLNTSVGTTVQSTHYPRKYLAPTLSLSPPVHHYGHPVSTYTLDEVDTELLHYFDSHHVDISYRQMAQHIGISTPTVSERIKKLIQRNIILGFGFDVEPLHFGMHDFMMLVSSHGHSKKQRATIQQWCHRHPSVTYIIEQFGGCDYEIGFEVQHPEDSIRFVQHITDELGEFILSSQLLQRYHMIQYRPFPF